jgi:hypothetical protein
MPVVQLCGCGFGTSSEELLEDHLEDYPDHQEMIPAGLLDSRCP